MVSCNCVAAVKCRPYYISVKFYCSGPVGSWLEWCLHLHLEAAHDLRGVNGVASFITFYKQFQ